MHLDFLQFVTKKSLPVFLLSLFFIFSNCNKNEDTSFDYYTNIKTFSDVELFDITPNIDSIFLDISNIFTSDLGFIRIYNKKIYYVDQKTCVISVFNKDGLFLESKLGKGLGPQEITADFIMDYLQTDDGMHIVLDYNYTLYVYDKGWNILSKNHINWQEKHSREEMLKSYEASMPGLYSFNYNFDNIKGRYSSKHLYFEIIAEHPEFNMIISEEYFKRSRIVGKINTSNGHVENILGRRSPYYLSFKFLGHLSYLFFDSYKQDSFILTFEADSLIYKCSKNFIPILAFGRSGQNMNTNYTLLNNFKDAELVYHSNRKECGYYTSIEYVNEVNLLFRTYTKGSHAKDDGLQVYKDEVLVADMSIPNGFKIEGYIHPHIYSIKKIDVNGRKVILNRILIDF
ncbi:MAG: hypothetical protein KGZ97_11660 [Bacteroidetes bacterium]|nr:hypothetical protein [Bacteroidota bacterium]